MKHILSFQSEKKLLPDGSSLLYSKVKGPIDTRTVYEFEQKIKNFFQQGSKNLVLNFKQVTYINSTGMGLLVKLSDSFHNSGGNIRLVDVSEKVIALFDMLGLISLFKMYNSDQEAINEITQKILEKKCTPPKISIQKPAVSHSPRPPQIPQAETQSLHQGVSPIVIDETPSTSPKQPTKFPHVDLCSVCQRSIEFATVGNFKCQSCSSYISIDQYGQQKVYARFHSDVIELTFPCNIHHKNVAMFAVNGLAQQLGYSHYFWEEIKEVLEVALTIALEKNHLQAKEKLHLLAVADQQEMVIGLKSMNQFVDARKPKDPRLPRIANKLDKLEVFPLPTRGQLLKMTKKNKSSMAV